MSDITPADALRELGEDQAEYAAAAAKKLGLPESVESELERLRGSDLVLREQVAKQGAEIARLRAAIHEYDPADALHEMLDIDPTDPVNARAHRKAHERRMGEWHDRVVGRDRVINAMANALFEQGPDELTRLCNAQQVFKAWESNSAYLAPVASDAEHTEAGESP